MAERRYGSVAPVLGRGLTSCCGLVSLLACSPAPQPARVEPISSATTAPPVGSTRDPRKDALAAHAVAITPRPFDEPLDDLRPLRPLFEGAAVVGLGEPSHRDGAAFLAKLRLVRYLHEELGFDTLLFESPRWDCERAWEAIVAAEVAPSEAVKGAVFGIWTKPAETRALWPYIADQARGPSPLRLGGIDMQFGDTARARLVADLRAFLGAKLERKLGPNIADVAFLLERVKDWQNPPAPSVASRVERSLLALERAVEKDVPESPKRREWLDTFDDLLVLLRWTWRDPPPREDDPFRTSNPRDLRMAENALARQRTSRGGVIVWAATMHLARDIDRIEQLVPTMPKDAYAGGLPMGAELHRVLGEKFVSVGFFAGGGTAGSDTSPRALDPAPPGSLEALLSTVGAPEVVLDLRATRREPALRFLDGPLAARPLGYLDQRARWSDILDVAYYIETMTPVSLTAAPPRPRE